MRRKPATTPEEKIDALQDEVAKTHREMAFIKSNVSRLVKELSAELQPDTRALLTERLRAIYDQALTQD